MEHVNSQKPRILIVDDVEANRFILRNIIVDMGYQPVLAENGVQALKIFPRCNPQLVLLDVAMPEMDGFEFCKIVKDNPNTRDVPIIFISAFVDGQDIVKGFKMGCEDYVTKPFIPEVVKARVGVHLKLSVATKNLSELNRRLQMSVHEQLEQMEQEKKSVLYALANVARENSCYGESYLKRLQHNCRILAQAMQLSEAYENIISETFVEAIELAAPLCDVGNIAVPLEILRKNSELTPDEIEIKKRHTIVGAKILEDLNVKDDYNEFMQMAVDLARYHHENWDGSGYPEGISGEQIPLAAQIVAVVDTYCALTEQGAGRRAYTNEEAVAVMQGDAGVRFHTYIYEIFKKISRQLR